jgi:hypothetical protein
MMGRVVSFMITPHVSVTPASRIVGVLSKEVDTLVAWHVVGLVW